MKHVENDPSTREQQIMSRLALGDLALMAELYDLYGGLVYSLMYRIIGDTGLAEDLVQEVFVRVWRSASSYRPQLGSVRSWLLTIAHHCAIDEWRRKRNEKNWVSLNSPHAEWLAVTKDQQKDPFIFQAMAQLPVEQRQIIELAYFQGYTISEIAHKLNLAQGTVKSRMRLAMNKLRSYLDISEEYPT